MQKDDDKASSSQWNQPHKTKRPLPETAKEKIKERKERSRPRALEELEEVVSARAGAMTQPRCMLSHRF